MRQRWRLSAASCFLSGWAIAVVPSASQEEERKTPRVVLGQGSALAESSLDTERVWLVSGQILREAPNPLANEVSRPSSAVQVDVIERTGEWVLVRYETTRGWTRLELGGALTEESAEPRPAPFRARTYDLDRERALTEERVERARRLMKEPVVRPFAPLEILTEKAMPKELLARLQSIASRFPEQFERRFGMPLLEPESGVSIELVLFASESQYRMYEMADPQLNGLETAGHAGANMLTMFVGNRTPEDVISTFVHELTHVHSRRAGKAVVPIWFDEGMAEEFSLSRVTESGEILFGTLPRVREEVRVEHVRARPRRIVQSVVPGGLVQLACVAQELEARPIDLDRMLRASPGEFSRHDRRSVRYAVAAFLLREVLNRPGGREALAEARRRLEAGGGLDFRRTAEELGVDWDLFEGSLPKRLEELAPPRFCRSP